MTTVVIGAGVGGLVAARRLALAGERVIVLERGAHLGGRVRAGVLADVAVDVGAESFAIRGGAVATLLTELGLGGDVVEPTGSAWVALADRTVPMPVGGLLGIPSSPFASDVTRVVDAVGSMRAYADRVMPMLKVGRYERLGPLVRSRMGERVLQRLVAPVVTNVYGADPDEVPVDLVAPGLNGALTATGSLSSAVLRLRSAAPPGAAAQGVAGGVHRVVDALERDLRAFGGTIVLDSEVIGLHPAAHGPGFTVVTPREDFAADRVVLGADGAAALSLLRDAAPELAAMPAPQPALTRAVLIAVQDARLDAAPRGTGVLRAAGRTDVTAAALTHVSAKWPWLASRLPAGRHILRLAYRGADPVADAVVRADASALLGVPVPDPVDRIDAPWSDSAPPLAPETIALRRALKAAALPAGLAVTGSWTAGTGLASVVRDGERAARSIGP